MNGCEYLDGSCKYYDKDEGCIFPYQGTGYPPDAPCFRYIRTCKNCKFFEYDVVANVNGMPLIVGHELCKKWGEGCKTKEDGYCFLFEEKVVEKDE